MYGDHLKWCLGAYGGRAKKYKAFDAIAELKEVSLRAEYGKTCASHDPDTAGEYRINFGGIASWNPHRDLSDLEIRLPAHSENLPKIREIFMRCCERLQPLQAFAGLTSAMAWNRHPWQAQEYELATYFYGVSVGIAHLSLRLKNGIYSPTWLLAMSPDWYAKVGGDAGLQNAVGSSVQAQHYAGGVILQAGDYPEPLPTSEALPTLWKNYNAWLKPIRNPQTGCFHITTLSEDQYFDKV